MRRRLATYPDFKDAILETAAYLGVDPDRLVLTNGLDEGILLASVGYLGQRTPEALAELGAPLTAAAPEIVVSQPAFEPYLSAAHAMGARIISVPPGRTSRIRWTRCSAAVTVNTRIVYVNNPNNPTGQPIAKADIRKVAAGRRARAGVRGRGVPRLPGRELPRTRPPHYPNVIVGRTFSKAFGLAGMRVGVMIASPAVLKPIRRAMPLFNLNVVAVAALRAALTDTEFRSLVPGAGHRVEGAALRRAATGWASATGRAPPTSC